MQALEGVTVLDFTQMTQGPWATQNLSDMGAEVLKIERPETGELRRHTKVAGRQVGGEATHFLSVNRNKKSITLDLKTERGLEICLDLAEEADVIVHNFRPDVMERLGLSYEDIKEVNEEIIYAETTGYGTSGPYADKPGQDLLLQSMTGLASITGRADDPPTPCGISVVDYHAATLLSYGIVLALFHRERTGEGQRLDTNLFNAAIDVQLSEFFNFMNMDIPLERSEEGIPLWQGSAPYAVYETKDGYITLSPVRTEDVEALGDLLDLPELADYSDRELYEQRDRIKREIEAVMREKPTAEWLELLEAEDVWCAPVRDYHDMYDRETGEVLDEQLTENDMVTTVEHSDAGTLQYTGIPVNLHGTPGEVKSAPPALGEHTEEVLEDLGYAIDEIEDLRGDVI